MFSKKSRYRKLEDIATTDAKGRTLTSKNFRLLPEVTGTFIHTVEQVDRLDHLAFKFYKQPRKWWRICDANPEFMSSQALLGKDPLRIDRFPLIYSVSGEPPWSELLKKFGEIVGVENLQFIEEAQIVQEQQTIGGQQVQVFVEHFGHAIIVVYNEMNITSAELLTVIKELGFSDAHPERLGRIGKNIIIPADIVT